MLWSLAAGIVINDVQPGSMARKQAFSGATSLRRSIANHGEGDTLTERGLLRPTPSKVMVDLWGEITRRPVKEYQQGQLAEPKFRFDETARLPIALVANSFTDPLLHYAADFPGFVVVSSSIWMRRRFF